MKLEKGQTIKFDGKSLTDRRENMVTVKNVDDDKIEFSWTDRFTRQKSYGFLVMSTGKRMNVPQAFIQALATL